jgi:SAM-dependent methyltransferase
MPNEIVPTILGDEGDPEAWKKAFSARPEGLDLIISNSNLHWVNDLEGSLQAFRDSLKPDGVFLASAFGGDSL